MKWARWRWQTWTPPVEPFGEVVTHCNARTEYEAIDHVYQPETCRECERIRALFR